MKTNMAGESQWMTTVCEILSLDETEKKHTRDGKVDKYLLKTTSSLPGRFS